ILNVILYMVSINGYRYWIPYAEPVSHASSFQAVVLIAVIVIKDSGRVLPKTAGSSHIHRPRLLYSFNLPLLPNVEILFQQGSRSCCNKPKKVDLFGDSLIGALMDAPTLVPPVKPDSSSPVV
ncbi:hypothetical protein SDJN03_19558, partial [Cucurbita argyrosperma subsp. sororia]